MALQHNESIQDRSNDSAANTAGLSRIQTPGESKEIIEGLKNGKIDLVVGSHRILSQEVKFKNRGL
ncbi:hypothetical protein AEL98_12080 [Lactobacillus crispatus]|nr:hypothetical protein AEL98_12080 [Lactobacillus crispatus]